MAVPPRECSVVWSALSSSRGSPSGNVARSTPSAGPVGHYARFQISLRATGSPCEPGLYPGPSAASCRNAANLSSSRRWAASYLCNTSSASAVRCPSARSSSIRRRWRAKAFSPLAAIASKSSILLARSESMSAAMHDGLKGGVTSLRPADCRDGSTLISSQGRLLATDPVRSEESPRPCREDPRGTASTGGRASHRQRSSGNCGYTDIDETRWPLEHDGSSWNQLDPSCLLQHAFRSSHIRDSMPASAEAGACI